ncbi:MAG: hypothetical protein CMN50_10660 [SAR116 cluster bacterium]|nr:hypothetical protein [SAR116 cluster bacterium]
MNENLVGQFLIAMPGLQDPRFQKTVILICEYSKTAVMGLILNKQIYNLTLGKILSHEKKENAKNNCFNEAIFSGGPVHTKQGFILHTNEKRYQTTEKILHNVSITTSMEILDDIGINKGPLFKKIFLGCSVWGYDQFNREILENSWLTIDGNKQAIFKNSSNQSLVWESCMSKLGIKTANLVSFYGKA